MMPGLMKCNQSYGFDTHVKEYSDDPERYFNDAICLPSLQVEILVSSFQQFDQITAQLSRRGFIEFIIHQEELACNSWCLSETYTGAEKYP